MLDLFEELYGSRRYGRYSEQWTEPEFTGDPIPDKHGWRYHLATGCRCETCERECLQRQDQTSQHVKPIPEDALTYEEWKAARAA